MNDQVRDNDQESGVAQRAAGPMQLVRAGDFHFGILAEKITAIVPWREPAPLPDAPKAVLGIVSIQGRMLTVLDLMSLPTGKEVSDHASEQAPGHLVALRGDEQLAIAVDRVGGIIEPGIGDMDRSPEVSNALVLGVLSHQDLDINILNLDELFSSSMQGRERRRRRF